MFKIIKPFLPYRNPIILNSYDNIIELLKKESKTKPFIITDKGIIANNLINSLLELFNLNRINYSIYSNTNVNPTIQNVEEARLQYVKTSSDSIIAIGGGSPIDLAKAVGARIVCPKKQISQMKGLLHVRKKLPLFFAIPTTAGTGSEATIAAVITDSINKHKYIINDFSLIPDYALLDYHLTLDLPPQLTATTGMDALTHAVEAYIGNSTTKYTEDLSKTAIKLILENLELSYFNPHNKEARHNMLLASHYAGLAFTRSYVGYVHAIAHSIGGQYNLPHGLLNAIILPVVLKEYNCSIYNKLSKLSKELGIAKLTDNKKIASDKFISLLEKLNQTMNIPTTINIDINDIPIMATHAVQESNPLYPVPRLFSKKELIEIYKKLLEKKR